jgi:hypothetical protein
MAKYKMYMGSFFLILVMTFTWTDAAERTTILRETSAQPVGLVAEVGGATLADIQPSAEGVLSESKSNLDRKRYIDTSELKRGMKGYGLTVFAGTEPEKFEVEVVSVIQNFMPKMEIILVRCLDERHKFSKQVGGDSGSPVFFDDRLAGALAYGWANSSEPLYGVTPIRHMLDVQKTAKLKIGAAGATTSGSGLFGREVYHDLMRDELLTTEQIRKLALASGLVRQPIQSTQEGWQTLPLSLTVGGFSRQAIEYLQTWIPGLVLDSAGSGVSSGGGGGAAEKIKLQRGSALTIPLMTGDISMRVLGTVTEVDGDKVFGFGHPFQSEGKAAWPMGTGYVHKVVNKIDRSFKLGEAVDIVGLIEADESAAVYGQIGKQATMIPMEVKVRWPQQAETELFKMEMLQHETMNPMLAASAILDALLMRGELPRENTIRYQMKMDFDGAKSIAFENYASGTFGWNDMASEALSVVALMLDNPWEKIKLAGVQVEMEVQAQETLAYVKSIKLGQRIYRPGESVHAELALEVLHQPESSFSMQMNLPDDIPPGKYKISVGSASLYRQQLRLAQPHRNMAFKTADIQRVLQERLHIDQRGVYMMMILPRQGVALEDQWFSDLPGSKTLLLTDKSRGVITTPFRSLVSAHEVTDFILVGGKTFDVEIRKE